MVVVNKIVLLSPTTEEFVILSSFSISRKTVLPAGQERHDFVAGSNDKPWDFAASSVRSCCGLRVHEKVLLYSIVFAQLTHCVRRPI